MPHINVKLYAGRSAQVKANLADQLTRAVTTSLGQGADAVSVAIEDIEPSEWMARVYEPDIAAQADKLFKKPGYGPLR